ncbi:MAG TPA: hypothetical protein DDZ80_30070 [Cyanobacteria bacterium UBA8803]|nr:hypothetical protein [Cyanobacteria bacterium UBA8803]
MRVLKSWYRSGKSGIFGIEFWSVASTLGAIADKTRIFRYQMVLFMKFLHRKDAAFTKVVFSRMRDEGENGV